MVNDESSLFVSLDAGDQLRILGGPATIELVHKSGRCARVKVVAGADVRIEQIKDSRAVHDTVPTVSVVAVT